MTRIVNRGQHCSQTYHTSSMIHQDAHALIWKLSNILQALSIIFTYFDWFFYLLLAISWMYLTYFDLHYKTNSVFYFKKITHFVWYFLFLNYGISCNRDQLKGEIEMDVKYTILLSFRLWSVEKLSKGEKEVASKFTAWRKKINCSNTQHSPRSLISLSLYSYVYRNLLNFDRW